jgi:putative FmdB family regulatory protein
MPIYEYQCKECGSQFEVIRSMKEADSPIDCHECHSQKVNRMISLFVAKSGERTVAGGGGGCAGCGGGTCAGCHH